MDVTLPAISDQGHLSVNHEEPLKAILTALTGGVEKPGHYGGWINGFVDSALVRTLLVLPKWAGIFRNLRMGKTWQ